MRYMFFGGGEGVMEIPEVKKVSKGGILVKFPSQNTLYLGGSQMKIQQAKKLSI